MMEKHLIPLYLFGVPFLLFWFAVIIGAAIVAIRDKYDREDRKNLLPVSESSSGL